eukprot:4222799-Prymnesium_polylepis.1
MGRRTRGTLTSWTRAATTAATSRHKLQPYCAAFALCFLFGLDPAPPFNASRAHRRGGSSCSDGLVEFSRSGLPRGCGARSRCSLASTNASLQCPAFLTWCLHWGSSSTPGGSIFSSFRPSSTRYSLPPPA